MRRIILLVFIILLSILRAQIVHAQEESGFTAICTTDKSRRYDSGYAYDGSRMEPEWSENENFFTPDWAFSYKGGDRIEIAGKEHPVAVFSPELLFAVEQTSGISGASMWTYAINLEMKELVATYVQSNIGGAPQITARIVTFDCKWSFH